MDKTLRVIHVSNYFSKVRAVFSSGPQTGLQIVSREMLTSSAQILCKAYASSSCSFLFAPTHRHLQRLMHRCIMLQQSTMNIHDKFKKNFKLFSLQVFSLNEQQIMQTTLETIPQPATMIIFFFSSG